MSGNESLLAIAKRNLYVAKSLYRDIAADDGYINIVGFHIQQAVELALKDFLEYNGIEYPKTHDIGALTAFIPEDQAALFEEVENMAANITEMEARTRYLKNFRLSMRIVDKAMKVAENLIALTERLENP